MNLIGKCRINMVIKRRQIFTNKSTNLIFTENREQSTMKQQSRMIRGKTQITRTKMMMSICPALSLINTLLNKSQIDHANFEISWRKKISILPCMITLTGFRKSAKIAQIMAIKGKTTTILFLFSLSKSLKMTISVHSSKTP